MSSEHEHDLAELREFIRFRGDYQNVRKFPNSAVNKEIQKSFGKFWQLVAEAHSGFWDTETDITTVANQRYLALPDDAWIVQGIDRVDGDGTIELNQVGVGERNRYGRGTGTPVAYRLSSRGIEFQPIPDAAYTLRIVYTPKAPNLIEAKKRDWFNGWDDYVIECTLLALDRREGKPLAERERTIEQLAAQVKSGVSARRAQEPEYLVIRENNLSGIPYPYGDID